MFGTKSKITHRCSIHIRTVKRREAYKGHLTIGQWTRMCVGTCPSAEWLYDQLPHSPTVLH